jgi:4-hydroxy-3-polyprenylbenzoate decarboxylase
MGTLARLATGVSGNLLERSADVILKQKRKILICPRETPLNLIHLRNMSSLVEAGAEMIPLMPGFYQKPKTLEDAVDFCVGKILEQLHLPHELYRPWNSRML